MRRATLPRHELAWLAPQWRDALLAPLDAGLAEAIDAWRSRGLPAVVARQLRDDPRDGVRLGVALSPDRARHAGFVVAASGLAATAGPPELRAALESAPAEWRPRLRLLDDDARRAGLVVRVYGSLAWQHLARDVRVRAASDVDLLVHASDAPGLARALAVLRRHDVAAPPRIDGEVLLPGGRGVAWRELLGRADRVLVKRHRSVALEPRRALLRAPSADDLIDEAAISALRDELYLRPKPGLVSPGDRGAHGDMDERTFSASLAALRGSFAAAARAGAERAPCAVLRAIGIDAERRMLDATGGVNTHRGAIFSVGLLAAAAGAAARRRSPFGAGEVRDEARRLAPALVAGLPQDARSHGGRAVRAHGVPGARGEAEEAFPHVFEVALPALARARARGAEPRAAALETLMHLVAVLPDTNLLHRGGRAGLEFARGAARWFLSAGGVHRDGWEARALSMHADFTARRLSPGGSADLLAAALFVDRVGGGA